MIDLFKNVIKYSCIKDWRQGMNRIKKGRFFILLILVAAFVIPTLVFTQDTIAYIGELGGTVTVTVTKSNPGEVAAELGMLIGAGDTVKTGNESYTSIIFQDDGSRVKLGSNAVITLNATRTKKKLNKKIFLSAGKIFAKVTKKKGTDFQIKTPTSVSSVKGTRFILEEKDWGETWLWVLDDFVELASDAGKITVNKGQKGIATKDALKIEELKDEDIPVEPGKHEMIINFTRSDDTSMKKELHIEFER